MKLITNHGADFYDDNPKFGYRCLAVIDIWLLLLLLMSLYVSISNLHNTFISIQNVKYEAEIFLFIDETPDNIEIYNYGGHSFAYFDNEKNSFSWNEAKLFREALGGYLATNTSQDRNEFLPQIANNNGGYAWIGLPNRNSTDNFIGSMTRSLFFINWNEEQTDVTDSENKCVEIQPVWLMEYFDADNDTSYVICEWDTEDIPSGNQIMRFGNFALLLYHDLRVSFHAPIWRIVATSYENTLL